MKVSNIEGMEKASVHMLDEMAVKQALNTNLDLIEGDEMLDLSADNKQLASRSVYLWFVACINY